MIYAVLSIIFCPLPPGSTAVSSTDTRLPQRNQVLIVHCPDQLAVGGRSDYALGHVVPTTDVQRIQDVGAFELPEVLCPKSTG
jgi:hypothetical protein